MEHFEQKMPDFLQVVQVVIQTATAQTSLQKKYTGTIYNNKYMSQD